MPPTTLKKDDNPFTSVAYADSPFIDAFARLRVSNPLTLHDSQLQMNLQPTIWHSVLVGGGTATHLPNEASCRLRVGTASGDKVTRQTKEYFRYKSGKSQLIVMTGVLGQMKTNVTQSIGYFDNNNGVFFDCDGAELGVTIRSKSTGSIVNDRKLQSEWNLDKMDGTGKSGVKLDMTKSQIFFFDLEWLGVGRVRCGFFIDGLPIYCNEFNNSNFLDKAYMTTANLPVRYEIENTGVSASQSDMKQICSSVISEGGGKSTEELSFNANNGTTTHAVTAAEVVLAIRPKLLFNSIENREKIIPRDVTMLVTTNDCFWQVIQGGTLTGEVDGDWTDINATNSGIEQLIKEAVTIAGGRVIASGYALSGVGNNSNRTIKEINDKEPLTLSFDGTEAEVLALVCTALSGTSNILANIDGDEIY